jgi:hypothetical protein
MSASRDRVTLAFALKCAARNWFVFPCWWIKDGHCACGYCDCGAEACNRWREQAGDKARDCSPGKHPIGQLVPRGVIDASIYEKTIRRWLTRYPLANLALACGRSGLIIVDIDTRTGGDEAAFWTKAGPRRDTVRTLTPSGGGSVHLWFSAPTGEFTSTIGKFLPGVDIRAGNGYALLPPSNHLTGRLYEFEIGHSPDEIKVAPCPEALADFARIRESSSNPGDAAGHDTGFDILKALAGVPEGERQDTLFRAACSFRGSNTAKKVALQACRDAAVRCDPPFSEKSVRSMVDRVYRRYRAGKSKQPEASGQTPDIFSQLNQSWARLHSEPGFVIRLSDGKVVSVKRFCDETAPLQLRDDNGKKLNAGHEWLNSAEPRTVAREIFLPRPLGESPTADHVELYEDEDCYNHWRGWPAIPASEVDNDAINTYFAVRDWLYGDQPEIIDWLEDWITHKLRYPIVKQPNIPILMGPQGCGKDTLARFYVALFGAHGGHISGARLKSNQRFNSIMVHKLLVNISELEDASPQFFKDLISNKIETIELKFAEPWSGPSYLQVITSANPEHLPYAMMADDRRGGIFDACAQKTEYAARIDTKLVAKLETLIENPSNLAGIYPYFIKRDFSRYNPFAEPPRTDAKEALIRQHRLDGEQFIRDVLDNPEGGWVESNKDGELVPKRCDLASARDFVFLPSAPESLKELLKDRRGQTTIGKWLSEIRRQGTLNRGKPVRTKNGLVRLWPVRNPDFWYGATPDQLAAEYDGKRNQAPNNSVRQRSRAT